MAARNITEDDIAAVVLTGRPVAALHGRKAKELLFAFNEYGEGDVTE
jgi:hypothetical protein